MATPYHGGAGRVYLSTVGSGTAAPISLLTNWSLDCSTDTVEVTAFGDTNKTYVQGLPDLKGSFSGFWDSADASIFTAASSTSAIKMYLYPSTNATAKYAYGTAWLSASVECAVDGAVKLSGDFVAASSWGLNL